MMDSYVVHAPAKAARPYHFDMAFIDVALVTGPSTK
jgi:hypothetical protein